jgi:hypothetical protein
MIKIQILEYFLVLIKISRKIILNKKINKNKKFFNYILFL